MIRLSPNKKIIHLSKVMYQLLDVFNKQCSLHLFFMLSLEGVDKVYWVRLQMMFCKSEFKAIWILNLSVNVSISVMFCVAALDRLALVILTSPNEFRTTKPSPTIPFEKTLASVFSLRRPGGGLSHEFATIGSGLFFSFATNLSVISLTRVMLGN